MGAVLSNTGHGRRRGAAAAALALALSGRVAGCGKDDSIGLNPCDAEGTRLIAFASNRSTAQFDVFLYDVDGGAFRLLKDLNSATAADSSPARSSDRSTIAFVTDRGSGADILLYDSNKVPVGKDQKQHLEVTRDLVVKLNEAYGEGTAVMPEPIIREETAIVIGLDGQKMSKSYDNTLPIFGDEKALRKKIMGIVMDSRTPAEPKPDAEKNIAIQLLKLMAPVDVAADYENRLRAGGLGYGDLKKALFEHYWNFFAPYRAKRAELAANPDQVHAVLKAGAERARATASQVIARAKTASGLR